MAVSSTTLYNLEKFGFHHNRQPSESIWTHSYPILPKLAGPQHRTNAFISATRIRLPAENPNSSYPTTPGQIVLRVAPGIHGSIVIGDPDRYDSTLLSLDNAAVVKTLQLPSLDTMCADTISCGQLVATIAAQHETFQQTRQVTPIPPPFYTIESPFNAMVYVATAIPTPEMREWVMEQHWKLQALYAENLYVPDSERWAILENTQHTFRDTEVVLWHLNHKDKPSMPATLIQKAAQPVNADKLHWNVGASLAERASGLFSHIHNYDTLLDTVTAWINFHNKTLEKRYDHTPNGWTRLFEEAINHPLFDEQLALLLVTDLTNPHINNIIVNDPQVSNRVRVIASLKH